MSNPLDPIEGAHAMRDVAALIHAFYAGLKDEGFKDADAMRLTEAYVSGLATQREAT